jgi:hypothetical protein
MPLAEAMASAVSVADHSSDDDGVRTTVRTEIRHRSIGRHVQQNDCGSNPSGDAPTLLLGHLEQHVSGTTSNDAEAEARACAASSNDAPPFRTQAPPWQMPMRTASADAVMRIAKMPDVMEAWDAAMLDCDGHVP